VTKEGVIATDPVAYGRPQGGQQYVDEIKKVSNAPPSRQPSSRTAAPDWERLIPGHPGPNDRLGTKIQRLAGLRGRACSRRAALLRALGARHLIKAPRCADRPCSTPDLAHQVGRSLR